jgi:hypothetical protein
MRLPESASFVGSLLGSLGRAVSAHTDTTDVEGVTEAELSEALDAMARGDIEYVILETGSAFLQAAGSGDGPYQVQFQPDEREALVDLTGVLDWPRVRQVLLAYRRGDPAWRRAQIP